MMPPYTSERPWVAVVTINEFFSFFAGDKDRDLRSFEMVILGREIVATDQKRTNDGLILQESKYDNVDFVPALTPGAAAMEFLSTDREKFEELYHTQLTKDSKAIIAMTSIADMVVNDRISILMICHTIDQKDWINMLVDAFDDQFGLQVYTMVDLLDPEVDPCVLAGSDVNGDENTIRDQIERMKKYLSSNTDEILFFNQLTDSYMLAMRDLLEKRGVEDLRAYADAKGIWLDRRARSSKEAMIDAIIKYTVF